MNIYNEIVKRRQKSEDGTLSPMRQVSLKAWICVLLSAALQFFMFPTGGPMPGWRSVLCWFALVPFFYALSLPARTGTPMKYRQAFLLGYACGFFWYFGNCFWIYQTMYLYGGLPKPIAFGIVLLFSLYLGLYHGLFAAAASVLRPLGSRAWCLLPGLWVAVELARARITGFPWDLLGYTQVGNPLVTRLAPLAGVMGISFAIALINAALFRALQRGGRRSLAWGGAVLALAVLLELPALSARAWVQPAQAPSQLAVMLQENLSVGVEGQQQPRMSYVEELDTFAGLSLAPRLPEKTQDAPASRPAEKAHPDVILWPEAPSELRTNDPYFRARVGELARAAQAPVIAGSLGVDADPASSRGYFLYDSASLVSASGSYTGRYDKIHLVPWGEYVPFKEVFSFADKLTAGVGNMDRGHVRSVFHAGDHTYGVFICYESIFGDEVREFVRNGAEVLVNISDDGWYGETGAPWQHLNMARMRAIENHRWVLRDTNTGVTTAIDPFGRIAFEAPRHVRAAYLFPFAFEQGTTFYTRHGDWFAWLCVAASAAALLWSRRARNAVN